VKEVIENTMKERDTEINLKKEKIHQLEGTNKILVATSDKLKTTTSKLASTESELKTVTSKAEELDKQKTEVIAQLKKTEGERDEAQQKLAQWDIVNIPPGQVKATIEKLKKTEGERDAIDKENKILTRKAGELQARLDFLDGKAGGPPPQLPLTLKGKVLAVDEKFQFVVLDFGTEQGAKERGELIVSRNGNMVGKVAIATVDQNRCIANIVPGWQKGSLMEGDMVIAALVN
jgi:seryl-tRNA synthetase